MDGEVELPLSDGASPMYAPVVGYTCVFSKQVFLSCFRYADLKTNLPKRVMAFHDFDFPEDTPDSPHMPRCCIINCTLALLLFHDGQPSRAAVREYLDSYASKYSLLQYCEFGTVAIGIVKCRTD